MPAITIDRRADIRVLPHIASLEDHNLAMTSTERHRTWVVLTTLTMVAVNLRAALSSIPTVETEIQAATGWSNAAIGTLTTIPVVCMGILALAVPRVARGIGRRRTVALALAVLVVAMGSRLAAQVPIVLTISVLLAGVGIALAMGLVPTVVRAQVPDRVGLATGIWTGAMMTGAALGGALTVPLAKWLGSWQMALAVWAIPALAGLIVWLAVEGLRDNPSVGAPPSASLRDMPWRSRPAWALTAFLTINSIVFYTLLAWLAPSFVDRGWTQEDAGFLFGVFTISQVAAALVMPSIAERMRARRTLFAAFIVVCSLSLIPVSASTASSVTVWVVILGFTLGGAFAMSLALLSEFAHDTHASTRLTAMAFFVTYVLASVGPIVAGSLLDIGISWQTLYLGIAVVLLTQLLTVIPLRRGTRIQ